MVSSGCLFFVNWLLFCIFFQENILFGNSDGAKCLNPTFDPKQKIIINYFFSSNDKAWLDTDICNLVNNSNGLISMKYRMSSDMKDKENCIKIEKCVDNRSYACYYKFFQKEYDDCNSTVPPLEPNVADCVCAGSADDILTANNKDLQNFGLQTTPVLAVDNKYDPCFTDYSPTSMKSYFCKAYKNALPFCQS